jgi:hypothetical protein
MRASASLRFARINQVTNPTAVRAGRCVELRAFALTALRTAIKAGAAITSADAIVAVLTAVAKVECIPVNCLACRPNAM